MVNITIESEAWGQGVLAAEGRLEERYGDNISDKVKLSLYKHTHKSHVRINGIREPNF